MIQNSGMLVELNIGCWTGRKHDKKVSREIDVAKGTHSRGGNYHKQLLAGTKKLEEVQQLIGRVRLWHYENTLPWADSGARLLPVTNFFKYKEQLNTYEAEVGEAVEGFLQEYPLLVSAAAFQLGDLFDRTEYPDLADVASKFRFVYTFTPIPDAGDFRIDIGNEALVELKEQYDKAYDAKLEGAMQDMWSRLYKCLINLSEKLADSETPRVTQMGETNTQIFRNSLITNAVDLCGLLSVLNVTNDPALEKARRSVEEAVTSVTPQEVRENDSVRHDTKARVDEILQAFNWGV